MMDGGGAIAERAAGCWPRSDGRPSPTLVCLLGGVADVQRPTKACGKRKKCSGRKCNVLQAIEITIAVVDGGLLCSGVAMREWKVRKARGQSEIGETVAKRDTTREAAGAGWKVV